MPASPCPRPNPRYGWAWGLYALLLLLTPVMLTSRLSQAVLPQIGSAIIVCLSYQLLLGQAGMLSFGHAVYAGLGSFFAIHLLNQAAQAAWPLPLALIPLLAGVASLLLAIPLGWLATRKAGTAFAMITLGMGELVFAASLSWPTFFGGEGGVGGSRSAGAPLLGLSLGASLPWTYLVSGYTLACTGLMYALTRTPLSCLFNAVRDNPERVDFMGYNSRHIRHMAFVIAAFFAGLGGALAALTFERATSDVLRADRSGAYLLFTVLGGSGFFLGPILGGIAMVLATVLLSEWTQAWLLYLGLAFVVTVLYAPGGLAGLLLGAVGLARNPCGLRRLWPGGLAVAVSACVTWAGAGGLVEMLYQLHSSALLGSQLRWLGLPLDAHHPDSWWGCAWVGLCGLLLFEASRRQLLREYRATHAAPMPPESHPPQAAPGHEVLKP